MPIYQSTTSFTATCILTRHFIERRERVVSVVSDTCHGWKVEQCMVATDLYINTHWESWMHLYRSWGFYVAPEILHLVCVGCFCQMMNIFPGGVDPSVLSLDLDLHDLALLLNPLFVRRWPVPSQRRVQTTIKQDRYPVHWAVPALFTIGHDIYYYISWQYL